MRCSTLKWFPLRVLLVTSALLSACGSEATETSTAGGSAGTGQAGGPASGGGPIDGTGGSGEPPPEGGAGAIEARDGALPIPDSAAARGVTFIKTLLNPDFYSEGINHGDLNRDGKQDIIAGPFWYPGPDFKSKVPFRQHGTAPFNIAGDSDCYAIFVYDMNQDGWLDILSFRLPGGSEAVWYENPQGAAGDWTAHNASGYVQDESPAFTDMDGDGKPELVTVADGYGGLIKPNWTTPQSAWPFVAITSKGSWGAFTHGLGTGDVNGDGRRDLLLPEGWWEQPPVSSTAPWVQHPAAFWGQELPGEGYGGAQMFTDDVDGDGDKDIVTSLQAHGWGLAWFENQNGTFAKHMIMNTHADEAQYGGVAFAQLHALDLADVDGDGLSDIVTGKRKGAHGNGLGAEWDAPAVLYWFKLVRQAGQLPRYEPHLIDSQAGVGTQVVVADVNADGLPDILTAARAGAFVFLGQ
jgi:FG-GAP-like repeat